MTHKATKIRILEGNQKGVTLIEIVIAVLVMAVMIVAAMRGIEMSYKNSTTSRNALRARDLAETKLEDLKRDAMNASLEYSFSSATRTARVEAYSKYQTVSINDKTFTWKVAVDYMTHPKSLVVSSTVPAPHGNTSSLIRFISFVNWQDITGARGITLTGYVTDIRQYD
jgi:prepilin-type N-terminal cleavage/methylation domain-containing protein